jgi:hypothetical protein
MDFIFMLTRNDQTIETCLDVVAQVSPLGIKHIGFKDVGVDFDTLRRLNDTIKTAGGTSYLEVVSTSTEACLGSARAAAEIGVDCLLGGIDVERMLEALEGSAVQFFPFVGRPHGHPTLLAGSPEDVAEDCARASRLGCAGVDLLAYRATEADPIALVEAARAATAGRLIVAGSVDSRDRVRALAEAGADAFTVGTAALAGVFSPHKLTLAGQLEEILAACAYS